MTADAMGENAAAAANFVKCFAHESRLMILCHLIDGERSVGELETLLGARQSAVSQHLARLRLDGIVAYRRDGKTLYYSIADERARRLLSSLHDLFCDEA
ncbi:MAG: metalloregulator ArsR/SmtB family transcription factor [Pseudomonadota bacterium]